MSIENNIISATSSIAMLVGSIASDLNCVIKLLSNNDVLLQQISESYLLAQ